MPHGLVQRRDKLVARPVDRPSVCCAAGGAGRPKKAEEGLDRRLTYGYVAFVSRVGRLPTGVVVARGRPAFQRKGVAIVVAQGGFRSWFPAGGAVVSAVAVHRSELGLRDLWWSVCNVAAVIVFCWSVFLGVCSSASRGLADEPTSVEKAWVGNPVVDIETNLGTVRVELFFDKAPKTAENFLDLVKQEFYDEIIFHRVIKNFMIQTGDPRGTGTGGRTDKGLPAKSLPDEFHPDLRHDRPGVLSMANAGPNTGDTQFFITTVPTPWLDNKHAVFGKVIGGMDVVQKIEEAKTDSRDRPVQQVKIERIRVVDP